MTNDTIQITHQVEDVIKTTAETLLAQKITQDKVWTEKIMSNLTRAAYDRNLWVCARPNEVDDTIKEWLYDMTWYTAFDEKGYEMQSIPLILESEWNISIDEIKADFYKLVQGRADLRVMLFQAFDVHETIDTLEEMVTNCPIALPGDNYLFAGWNNINGFTFKSFTKA